MLEYHRVDISKEIDIKTHLSKECDIGHYWYFKDISFNMSHIFAMFVTVYCKKLWILMMLLLLLLKEVIIEFIFDI